MDRRAERHYVWKEYKKVEDDAKPRLVTPWADPNIHEFAFDFLFASPGAAVRGLVEWGALEDAKADGWILCSQETTPLFTQPKLPDNPDEEADDEPTESQLRAASHLEPDAFDGGFARNA